MTISKFFDVTPLRGAARVYTYEREQLGAQRFAGGGLHTAEG